MRGAHDDRGERSTLADGSVFHDLGKMYPDAPIPEEGGQILRNAVIDGSDGLPVLMDWVSPLQCLLRYSSKSTLYFDD